MTIQLKQKIQMKMKPQCFRFYLLQVPKLELVQVEFSQINYYLRNTDLRSWAEKCFSVIHISFYTSVDFLNGTSTTKSRCVIRWSSHGGYMLCNTAVGSRKSYFITTYYTLYMNMTVIRK